MSLVPAQDGKGHVSVYNPMYGLANTSYAVEVPRKLLRTGMVAKSFVRTSGGDIWRDKTLEEWPVNDTRLFIGDLGQHVSDASLTQALRAWKGFNMARVVRNKATGLCRGYGFASFASIDDAQVCSPPTPAQPNVAETHSIAHAGHAHDLGHGSSFIPRPRNFGGLTPCAPPQALIRHQRGSKDLVRVAGRPVVVKLSNLDKKTLRPQVMPEVRRLQELKRQILSEEALTDGGKVRKRIKIGGMYITNAMRRAAKRSLLQAEERQDHKDALQAKRQAGIPLRPAPSVPLDDGREGPLRGIEGRVTRQNILDMDEHLG